MRKRVIGANWPKAVVAFFITGLLSSFVCLPAHASVGEIRCSGSNWSINVSGPELTLNGSQQCIGSLVVPDNITALGDFAFDSQVGLTSIYLPDSITSIGDYAFLGCTGLKSVRLPAGLQTLPISAFDGASALTSISLPKTLTTIGSGAFYHATALRSIVIPEGVTQLSDDLFNGATALNSVTLPKTLRVIGDRVFHGASSLTSITIPDGVTTIGQAAFQNNFALESIYLPDTVTSIGDNSFDTNRSLTNVRLSNNLTSIPANAFYGAHSLRNLRIPPSVTSIGESALFGNNALESLTIPSSVTSIGDEAFKSSSSLHRIYIMDDSSVTYGARAFDGLASQAQFFVKGTSASNTSQMLAAANGGSYSYQLTIQNYSVSFDANGATSGDLPYVDDPMPSGSMTFPENDGNLSKSGYTFAGWNTQADGTGITYEAGKTHADAVNNSDKTFYAKWVEITTPAVDTQTTTPSRVSKSFTFSGGSATLTSKMKSDIKRNLATYKDASSISIVGGAGYLRASDKARVTALAKKRAQAIKSYMVKMGVSKSKIKISVKRYKIGLAPRTKIVSVTVQ